jgi:hypothetical protein
VGRSEDVADAYWNALDRGNRVALAVKEIASTGASRIVLRNRFQRV